MFGHNEYVYAVYKEGSFSKAAEKLHISQPALSAIILKEEEEIGCPIFDRRKRPIELTAFGTEYIRSIGKIYAIEKELSDYITSAKTLESGEVTLCGTNLGLLYKVPVVIAKFKQQYPNITVHVAESCTRGSIQQLNSAEVDLVLTSKPLDSHRYVQEVCYQERLILAIPRCFPVNEELTAKKRFSYEELQQMPYHISKEEMYHCQNWATRHLFCSEIQTICVNVRIFCSVRHISVRRLLWRSISLRYRTIFAAWVWALRF